MGFSKVKTKDGIKQLISINWITKKVITMDGTEYSFNEVEEVTQ